MKKILSLLIVLLFVVVAYATGPYPNKQFGQDLGKDGRSYGAGYFKNSLIFEGATTDAYETTFSITEPTADRTITFQDASGTVAYTANAGALTPSTAGGYNLGSAALPWSGVYIGDAASTNLRLTGTATAARVVTIPDATMTLSGLKYYNSGTGTSSANTNKSTSGLFYSGSAPVVTNTNVTISGFSPAFTSTATFNCLIKERTPTINYVWKCEKLTSASIKISTESAAAVSDTIDYILMGY